MFNPQQFQMAQEMMKNMSPEQMQNMMKMAQENPHLMQQARNMMNNQNFQNSGNPYPNSQPQTQPQKQKHEEEFEKISNLKQKGNSKYKEGNLDEASAIYIEAILDVDQFRKRYTNKIQRDNNLSQKIDKLEIDLRNNYCTVKRKCREEEYMIDHCDRVLKIDNKNFKALYNIILAHKSMKNKENELFYINKALQYYPNQADILNLKDEATQQNKEQVIKEQQEQEKEIETQIQPEKNYEQYFTEEKNNEKEKQSESQEQNIPQKTEISKQEESQTQAKEKNQQQKQEDTKKQDENIDFDIQEETQESINQEQKNTYTQSKTNKMFQQSKSLPQKKEESFMEKNFKLFLGILIGLLISYMFRK